jgi:imidazolonepropionase-like amidohydrolase
LAAGAWIVPTLLVGEMWSSTAKKDGPLRKCLSLIESTTAASFACLRKAVEAGVRVALGTDYCGWDVQENIRELQLMTDHIGMSPQQVLVAATSSAADLLMLPVGRLRKGAEADIIALTGNPLQRPLDVRNVCFVMARGQVVVKT